MITCMSLIYDYAYIGLKNTIFKINTDDSLHNKINSWKSVQSTLYVDTADAMDVLEI